MGLRDELAAENPVRVCKVAALVRNLSGEEHEEFVDLLTDLSVPSPPLARMALRHGWGELSISGLNAHRRGYCSCR